MKAKKILIIDDSKAITDLIKMRLSEYPQYQLTVENDATKAAAAAQSTQPDLILLDIMMPDRDGGEVASHIRKIPGLKHIPIVYMTGAVQKDEVDAGNGFIGGEPFIAKPFDLPYLISRLRQHLQQ